MKREDTKHLARPKKAVQCRACLNPFFKTRPMQRACSPLCAEAVAKALRYKKERREAREALQAHKREDRRVMLKRAEGAINLYVKLRDHDKGCISCHLPAHWAIQWHASHYRSVGAASSVRFNLWNIHKACSVCNNNKSGNISEYMPRLVQRIGQEKVDWLKQQNKRADYTCEYLERLRRIFAKKARRAAARIKNQQELTP